MSNEYNYLLRFFIYFLAIMSLEAYKEIKAYRLVQYEKGESKFGSQYASLNYIGSHHRGDVTRKISLVKLKELSSISDLERYLSSKATAYLIIIPQKSELNDSMKSFILQAQKYLADKEDMIEPVYFTNDSKNINEIYSELESEIDEDGKVISGIFTIENNLLQFSLNVSEPKKVESIQLENMYGYLEGSTSPGQTNPIIAIVANYDDISLVPDMPSGMNSNASGVIALVEIMRIISKFYENYDTFVGYDLMFLLTSGGNLNFKGGDHFINSLESSMLENIHFVICLDSLAPDEEEGAYNYLFVHLSEFVNNQEESAYKFQKVRFYL